ncbi:hypothetical protein KAFR_0K01000 [Kazachstania africana CBS 2517]|uniref:RRM domain-containing protein n=1 Tax=Kazachstania africana (strain ATCC 22294 / BCRC 22015 / CBS 2517 / CECT 1963 / NBRC 1671 / NRRL Y-8276) TaxID=1071382 RepID=H2B1F6_KAZAF|nr:hypothetical protein KAFR_0K01000 [Kazachstania africana CBS 2517]CCF60456.1 hypothetical protein KAFR_0K01000 [Kazachstania africana CBS 2517]
MSATAHEAKSTLYVNNLNTKVNSKKLRVNLYLLFSIYGEVLKVSTNFRKERGQAFITMKGVDDANLALLSLNDEMFFDKKLHVEFSKNDTVTL